MFSPTHSKIQKDIENCCPKHFANERLDSILGVSDSN